MGIITLVSASGAPGVSTTVAALSTTWPQPVVAVDADPVGASLLPGWLQQFVANHVLDPTIGLGTFTAASTYRPGGVFDLTAHTQPVPRVPNAHVLAGHPDPTTPVPGRVWRHLAAAAREHTSSTGADVLVDAGRWGTETPWPVLTDTDLVLLCLRPDPRFLAPAGAVVASLRSLLPPQRLALAVLGAEPGEADGRLTELATPVAMCLPSDRMGARVFSDGLAPPRAQRRTRLREAARNEARHLHTRLHSSTTDRRQEALR